MDFVLYVDPNYPCGKIELRGEMRKDSFDKLGMKDALWLSMIAMLLSVLMVNVGQSPVTNTKLYLDPPRVPGPGQTGLPGEEYNMTVNIENVDDLWAASFTIQYPPYVSIIVLSEGEEGPFLSEEDTWPTFFTYSIDAFQGTADVAILRLPIPGHDRVGASGDGVLMTFKLTVIEAGEGPITIENSVLLNSEGDPIPHQTRGSYYYGPKAVLVRVEILPSRRVKAGVQNITFWAKVRSESPVPLWVRVRFDIERIADGRRIVLYTGQTYFGGGLGEPLPHEYVYVDEFDEWHYEWDGDPENLFGESDGNYIESDTNGAWACMYSFEDIEEGGMPIADIFLEGYTQYPNGATENVDIDIYDVSPGQGYPFAWWGSLYGTSSWDWHSPRWTTDSVLDSSPWLADKAALNDVWVLVHNYYGSSPDIMRVDSMRLRVEYSTIMPTDPPEYPLPPDEEIDLFAYWVTKTEHIGSYQLTATVEYTYNHLRWNSWGSPQKTKSFWIVDP